MLKKYYEDERTVERFWGKVQKGSADDCWPWLGSTSKKGREGYGLFCIKSKQIGAHRVSWEIDSQQNIPEGQCVLHTCDNPICVNPNHLWIGTRADNIADCVRKDRIAKGERSGRSRLTAADVRNILLSPDTGKKLAAAYNVHVSTISAIRSRKTWTHIEDPRKDR